MTTTDILQARLHNQLLTTHPFHQPREVAAHLGAIQAQSYEMARWAIGVRIPGSTNLDVEEAISRGEILRTHILRPTWHFVAAENIRWMLELTASRLKTVYWGYSRYIGFEESMLRKARPVIEKILRDHNHLTREEVGEAFARHGLPADAHVARHALEHSELDGLVCSGRVKGREHSYALLDERVPDRPPFHREEALGRLALLFFQSHSPATLQDFAWWSGLTLTDARKGFASIRESFAEETINGRTFVVRNDFRPPAPATDSFLLLPPFDEFVVSYKDRSEMIDDEHYAKVMTKNGIFSPTLMHNGRIVGSWKKVKKGRQTSVEPAFFEKPAKRLEKAFQAAAEDVVRFYG